MRQKQILKQTFLKELGLNSVKKEWRQAFIVLETAFLDEKVKQFWQELATGLATLDANFILVDSPNIPEEIRRTNLFPKTKKTGSTIYEAADLVLFLSSNEAILSLIEIAQEKKAVPVSFDFLTPEFPLQNYDPVEEKGNAFLYKNFNPFTIFAALVRALENYKFPYDWETNILRRGEE